MAFELAKLFVTIKGESADVDAKIEGVKGRLAGLASFASKWAVPLAAGAAAVTVVGAKLLDAASAAGDLAETVSKVETVLGGSSDAAKAFADSMHNAFGSSRREILDAVTTFTILGEKTGKSKEEAEKFGEVMVRLADDASSQLNTSFQEAFEKIRSGLAGQSEPLQAFQVFMNETAVKAEAMRLGLRAVNGELSEGQKIMARASYIQRELARVNNDHAATLGSYNNQIKELNGRMEGLKEAIGQGVVPVLNGLLQAINPIVKGLRNVADAARDMMSAFKIPPGSMLDSIMKSGVGGSSGAGAFGPLGSLLSMAAGLRGKSAPGASPAAPAGAGGGGGAPASSGDPRLDQARQMISAEKEKAAFAKILEAEKARQEVDAYHKQEREKDLAFGKLFVPGSVIPTRGGDTLNPVYEGINRTSEVNARNSLIELKSLGSAFLRSQVQGPLSMLGGLAGGGQSLLQKMATNLEKDKFRGSISDSESLSREIQQGIFDAESKRDEEMKRQTKVLEAIRDGINAMKGVKSAVAVFGR